MKKNSKLFDIIVLAGMVVNIILAVFLILYYFDFLRFFYDFVLLSRGSGQAAIWHRNRTPKTDSFIPEIGNHSTAACDPDIGASSRVSSPPEDLKHAMIRPLWTLISWNAIG